MMEPNTMNGNNMSPAETYANKMNEAMTHAMSDWWNSLSKEELLQYLADQPLVTADTLRTILSGMDVSLAFNVTYATSSSKALAAFSVGKKQ